MQARGQVCVGMYRNNGSIIPQTNLTLYMSTTHYYDISVAWQHDRKGVMSSTVLNDSLEVATPPEFAKGMAGIWSPEHLLVAAVNSCMITTFWLLQTILT